MKKPRLLNVALLLVCVLFVQNSRAQDHTRWGLPEGAIARLGKGRISGNIAYSPDGTLLAVPVPLAFGSTMRSPVPKSL